MYNLWKKFHASFHDSEVILFARLQMVAGIVLEVLVQTDMSPFISNPKYLTGWLVLSGIATELLRRNRATDLDDPQ